MTTTGSDRPALDVTDMIAVHRVFRDTLGRAAAVIGAVGDGDIDRAATVANFFDNILLFLHVHHQGEDDLMFPVLRQRCPDQRELIDRVASQHGDADEKVAAAEGSLRAWSANPGAEAKRCAAAMNALGGHLEAHFADEEHALLPLCAQHLSAPEWGALPGHAMASFTGDKIWLILGLVADRMTAAQRDDMFAHMPPPVVDMWTNFGRQAFAHLVAQVDPPLRVPAAELP
ncbi:MAG: hypothetical protein QOF30_3396 [Acidimicrobiaceae bacterium]|jgi:hemerythrin-like domain-containing protein|nr:hypothetical protein [Acidimicrobiaceae bacterium]